MTRSAERPDRQLAVPYLTEGLTEGIGIGSNTSKSFNRNQLLQEVATTVWAVFWHRSFF
jgi:hypothetical protein